VRCDALPLRWVATHLRVTDAAVRTTHSTVGCLRAVGRRAARCGSDAGARRAALCSWLTREARPSGLHSFPRRLAELQGRSTLARDARAAGARRRRSCDRAPNVGTPPSLFLRSWGTTFPHLFLHTYCNLVPQRNPERYVPRMYGFKIHKSAAQIQRNVGSGKAGVAGGNSAGGGGGGSGGGNGAPAGE
jgi:uncharacterized membrane protein YgcG